MECPSCGVDMVDFKKDDQTLRKCGECGGLWVDVSDLNRMLLHHNLPGLESIGGKVDTDSLSGQCPDCQVEFVRVSGGDKSNPVSYETCESCGGIFLESDFQDASDFASAEKEIVSFFSTFSTKLAKKKVSAG
jgi:Zn-finger nucleic acid-binding protein